MLEKKILIAFYSQTGNTKRIAEIIARQTKGKILEIAAGEPYKSLYLGGAERVKQERSNGIHPRILPTECNVEQYDTVFLGTPNWGNGIAHPLMSFLDEHKFDGNTIYPFCTHGGGGLAHIAGDIHKFCPNAQVGKSYATYDDGGIDAEKTVQKWLKEIEMEG